MDLRSLPFRWRWNYLPRNVAVWLCPDGFLVQWRNCGGFVYASTWRWWRLGKRSDRPQQVMDVVWEGPMKRKALSSIASVRSHAPEDKWLSGFSNLQQFMLDAAFEGEEGRREAPTVTIWAGGGEWKAAVKDRSEGLVMWLSAPSLRELVKLMDTFCLSEDGPWRHDDHQHERNGKRKAKSS